MFSFDPILLEFVGGNWMSLYILLTLLKGIALITPSVKDDAIVTLLGKAFKAVRGGVAPMSLDAKASAAAETAKEAVDTAYEAANTAEEAAEAAKEAANTADEAVAIADEAVKAAEEYKDIRLDAAAAASAAACQEEKK